MATRKPITIIGGGLAGLTLGIGLRSRDVPVKIIEAGHYPKHRVCGEFISGQGPRVLARMGLSELLAEAGAIEGRTALFRSTKSCSPARPLPAPALCVSRFDLDALLARELQRLGGELREGERWRVAEPREGLVLASGRRIQSRTTSGLRWFGLKVHARNIKLDADLEMYLAADGYVGLCRLKDGWTNICGLFRAKPGTVATKTERQTHRRDCGETQSRNRTARSPAVRESAWSLLPLSTTHDVRQREQAPRTPYAPRLITRQNQSQPLSDSDHSSAGDMCYGRQGALASPTGPAWAEMIRGRPGTPLFERLKEAEFDERSFCSVAGLSLRRHRADGQDECRIGDALTMIPPVTGNGMSMAFESAEIAIEPLAAYSRDEVHWTRARAAVAQACDAAFGRRLRWARWLQWMMFAPVLQTRAGSFALSSEWLWQTMFAKTR